MRPWQPQPTQIQPVERGSAVGVEPTHALNHVPSHKGTRVAPQPRFRGIGAFARKNAGQLFDLCQRVDATDELSGFGREQRARTGG